VPSPDGNSLFYLKTDVPQAVFRTGKSGVSEETLFTFDSPPRYVDKILPYADGDNLLVTSFQTVYASNELRCHRLNVTSRKATDLGLSLATPFLSGVVWAEPGKSPLFSREVNGLSNLWKYDLGNQALTRLTFGPGPDYSPLPDPTGKGIYYVNGKQSGFLTVYHPQSRQSDDIASENSSQPAILPDGKRVMYLKFTGPTPTEVWVSDLDGRNKTRLAASARVGTGVEARRVESEFLRPNG
jgi:hypothetical protein